MLPLPCSLLPLPCFAAATGFQCCCCCKGEKRAKVWMIKLKKFNLSKLNWAFFHRNAFKTNWKEVLFLFDSSRFLALTSTMRIALVLAFTLCCIHALHCSTNGTNCRFTMVTPTGMFVLARKSNVGFWQWKLWFIAKLWLPSTSKLGFLSHLLFHPLPWWSQLHWLQFQEGHE